MEIKVRKLRDTLSLLETVPIKKAKAMPILTYFLLRDGKASATNLEVRVTVELPEVQEAMLLPSAVQELLATVPGDTLAQITRDGLQLTIACGASKATFATKVLDDYPPAPDVPEAEVHLDGDRFTTLLAKALPYAATDDTRPVLSGVSLFLDEDGTRVFAGDGFRMFYQELPERFAKTGTLVIPAGMVKAMAAMWKKAPPRNNPAVDAVLAQLAIARRMLDLGYDDHRMVAKWGNVSVDSLVIEGTPPSFRQLIPKEPPQKFKVFAPDFGLAVRRLKDVASEGSGIVRLEWNDGTLKLSAASEENKVETEVNVTSEGGPGRIAFNYRYLLEYFKDRQGMVEVGISSGSAPGLFLDGRCQVVVMPMFVSWGDEPKTADAQVVAPESPEADTVATAAPVDGAAQGQAERDAVTEATAVVAEAQVTVPAGKPEATRKARGKRKPKTKPQAQEAGAEGQE